MIKGMTMPKGGNRLPLILGLVLGLVAAVLVVVYLSSAKDEATDSGGGGGGGLPTVVAASDIAAGTRLSAEMLTVAEIPQEDQLAGYFPTTEGLINQVTKVSLLKGEQIVQSKVITGQTFEGVNNIPVPFLLAQGERGVSVELSALIGAGGNIRPGDFVDVILVVPVSIQGPNGEQFNDTVAGTILQNVKVLAVDQSRASADPAAATDPDAAKEEDELATTLTLAVTPGHAEVLAVADECGRDHNGRLAITLRGPGDTNELSNRAEWPADGTLPSCIALLGISALGE